MRSYRDDSVLFIFCLVFFSVVLPASPMVGRCISDKLKEMASMPLLCLFDSEPMNQGAMNDLSINKHSNTSGPCCSIAAASGVGTDVVSIFFSRSV